MSDDIQEDLDSAADAHQQQLERRRISDELFTATFPTLPRLTPKEQFEAEQAQLKALNWALSRIFDDPK